MGVDVGACEMPFSCIFERMRSEIRCPGSDGGVVGTVTVCVGFGSGLGTATGFGGSISSIMKEERLCRAKLCTTFQLKPEIVLYVYSPLS
ncbi:hypothetical protein, partial [uncultured Ruminococcus sp.]|uniref:hypothetical protein n=1 Tax=uncultured Ruminococcus sp. TaxID=165186 RepID=UPI0025EBF80C